MKPSVKLLRLSQKKILPDGLKVAATVLHPGEKRCNEYIKIGISLFFSVSSLKQYSGKNHAAIFPKFKSSL